VVTAVAAIAMLQGVLGRLGYISLHPDSAAKLGEELTRFRAMVLGLGVVFLVLINLSVILLVSMAWKILRPVDALMEATRELVRGRYEHRVTLREDNEFDELARAFNTLAGHLQETEKQRMTVLTQVGVALNHELNNAMATIELQLGMLGRGASGDLHAERRLRTIQESLTRMKGAVSSLRSVRRIVLKEYSPGMTMLDLEQSVKDDDATRPDPVEHIDAP
jgi:two-component system sensor histidine kinase BaeS